MSSPSLGTRRLGYALVGDNSGTDLRHEPTEGTMRAIEAALYENLVLCFPAQDLTREQFVAFARRFGQPDDNKSVALRDPENAFVTVLTTKPFEGKPWDGYKNGENWHSDRSYRVDPTTLTLLLAQELPDAGGASTMFANQYLAYETLLPAMQRVVEELSTVQLQNEAAAAVVVDRSPPVIHPLVSLHPATGRKALYLSEHIRRFDGMTEEESRPLLDFLFHHATRYEFCYRHAWRVHDLVVWDNRCLMHVALRDYDMTPAGPPRHLWRCSLRGTVTGVPATP